MSAITRGIGSGGLSGASPGDAGMTAESVNQILQQLGLYTLPTPVRMWAGAVKSTSFRVNYDVQLSRASDLSTVGLVVSTHADLSSPEITISDVAPLVTAGASTTYYTGDFIVGGATANTTYYYGAKINGVVTGPIGTLKTAPIEGTASSFTFGFGSCSNQAFTGADIYTAMANENFAFLMHLGDIAYSNITQGDARIQRGTNTRQWRNYPGVSPMLLRVPIVYIFDDHDSANDNNHYDMLYGSGISNSQIIANSRAVIRETCPIYPTLQDALGWEDINTNLLAQQFDWGRTRFILPDLRSQRRYAVGTPTIFGNGTNPPDSWDQETAIRNALTQAALDGQKIVFFCSSSTWYNAFDGWGTYFPADRAALCDFIRDLDIQVALLHGDSHQAGCDDGTNAGQATNGDVRFPLLMSSAFNQNGVFDSVTPLVWNGVDGDISGPIPTSTPTPGTGQANHYCAVTVTDNGGSDVNFSAVWKGLPFTGSTPTTLRTISSADASVVAEFPASTSRATSGTDANVPVNKSWCWSIDGCSVQYSGDDGSSGTITFGPNQSIAYIVRPYTDGTTVNYTLSSPANCALGVQTTCAASWVTLDADTSAYLAAMTTAPTDGQKIMIDDLIVGLKADGIWSSLMLSYWLAAHDEQAARVNMKSPGSNTLTVHGLPAFVDFAGYKGDGKTGFLDTGYAIPSGNQNSCSMWIWTTTAELNASGELGGDNYHINPSGVASDRRYRSSSGTTDSTGALTSGAGTGFIGWTRTASTGYDEYVDGVKQSTITRTSSAPTATTMWVCGWQNSGGSQFGHRVNAFAIIAAGLDATKSLNLYTRLHAFLQAMGTVV